MMTDLSDWGVEVEEPEPEEQAEQSSRKNYRSGRCPAISVSSRSRCRGPISRMMRDREFCATHGRQPDPWTIHDDPETLIIVTGGLDCTSLDDLEPEDVDFDLGRIQEALEALETQRVDEQDHELLTQVEGIGDERADRFLEAFGSGREVAMAASNNWAAIADVPGISIGAARTMFDRMQDAGVYEFPRGRDSE